MVCLLVDLTVCMSLKMAGAIISVSIKATALIKKICVKKPNCSTRWPPIEPAANRPILQKQWQEDKIACESDLSTATAFEFIATFMAPIIAPRTNNAGINTNGVVAKPTGINAREAARAKIRVTICVPIFSIRMPDMGIMVSAPNPKIRIKWPITLSVTPKRGTSCAICTAQPPVTKPLIKNSIVTAQRPFCVIFISTLLLWYRMFSYESSEFPSPSGALE